MYIKIDQDDNQYKSDDNDNQYKTEPSSRDLSGLTRINDQNNT